MVNILNSSKTPLMKFEIGKVYHRRQEIHAPYGGQQQGGMSTPKDYPVIFLFTGESGRAYGYADEFREDGIFLFYGEGQHGNMEFIRANRALRDHRQEGEQVHLFEAMGGGYVKYVSEVECVGYETIEKQSDRDKTARDYIVFHLALMNYEPLEPEKISESLESYSSEHLDKLTLKELRELALQAASPHATQAEKHHNVRLRSGAIREYVLKRANGLCEGCEKEAPFKTRNGRPYLEVHHLLRLADGGPDHPLNVIALCPNCHRYVHHASDGARHNNFLIEKVASIEKHL